MTTVVAQDAAPASAVPPLSPAASGENVAIHLQGNVHGVPLDVKYLMDTCAPSDKEAPAMFNRLYTTGEGTSTYNVNTTVRLTDKGYQAKFDLRVDYPMPQGNGVLSYRAATANTVVLLQPGQPMDILSSGDTLTATLEKQPAVAPAADLPTIGKDGRLDANLKAVVQYTNADGKVNTISIVIGGTGQANYNSVVEMANINGKPSPIIGTLKFQLRNEAGGLGVNLSVDRQVPTVGSATIARGGSYPGALTTTIMYRNLATAVDVLVRKLDDPVTVYTNGKEGITLTLTRTDK